MEKNKLNYITYLVIFCVILSFVGCFFLGTYFGEKETVTKTEEKNPDEEIFKSAKIEEYSIYTLTALYNFTQSSQRDFNEYLTNLSNSQKLYVAGLVNYLDEDNKYNNKSFDTLKENLISVFGSDLGVQPEDYYMMTTDEEPLFKYNKDTNEYVYNENTIGTDVLTDFQNAYVYNFKLASEEKIDDNYVITYYGLFAFQNEIGPTSATNLTNISRLLNYDSDYDGLSDKEYFENAFKNNKDDFFKLIYTYKLVDNKLILVDFKQA